MQIFCGVCWVAGTGGKLGVQKAERQRVVYLLVWEVETVRGIIGPLGTGC